MKKENIYPKSQAVLAAALFGAGNIAAGNIADGISKSDFKWLTGSILAGGVAAPVVLMFSLRSTPAATASLLL